MALPIQFFLLKREHSNFVAMCLSLGALVLILENLSKHTVNNSWPWKCSVFWGGLFSVANTDKPARHIPIKLVDQNFFHIMHKYLKKKNLKKKTLCIIYLSFILQYQSWLKWSVSSCLPQIVNISLLRIVSLGLFLLA